MTYSSEYGLLEGWNVQAALTAVKSNPGCPLLSDWSVEMKVADNLSYEVISDDFQIFLIGNDDEVCIYVLFFLNPII